MNYAVGCCPYNNALTNCKYRQDAKLQHLELCDTICGYDID